MANGYQPLQNTYSKLLVHVKEHTRMYVELILFVIFVGVFMTITALHRDVYSSHTFNAALESALVNDPIDPNFQQFPVTFTNIQQWNEMNNYFVGLLGPLLTTARNNSYEVMHGNRLVGGVRFRQLRVKKDSCYLSGSFKKIFSTCYAETYDQKTKDNSPFGPPDNTTKYKYESGAGSGSTSIWGHEGGYYDGGGYISDFSIDTNFTAALLELKNDSWWDAQTRVIIIALPFANANLNNRISILYLVLEMNAAGKVSPFYMFRSFRFNMYVTTTDWVRMGLEIVFALLLLYFIFVEFAELYKNWKEDKSFWKYFTTLWNYVEVANLSILVSCSIMYVTYLRFPDVDLSQTTYIPQLEQMGQLFQNIFNLTAINVLLSAFNVFKYLSLNTRLYLLWHTLGSAGTDLVYFLFIFLVVFFGFVLMAYLTFGPEVIFFSTFTDAIGSCWQFIIGNPPSFEQLFTTNRVLGPLFYSLFTVFIFFVLVNMFIAIVTNAFTNVHDRVRILKKATSITQELWSAFHCIKETMSGNRPISDKRFLKGLKDKEVLDLPVLTTEDAARAIGGDATPAQIERLKALHLRFRHAEHVESTGLPGEVEVEGAGGGTPSL